MENHTNSFTDLRMWQKAHIFVIDVYKISEFFPKHELFGLVSQFRRAAVSIAANIAEGYRKKGKQTNYVFSTSRRAASKSADTISFFLPTLHI